MKWNNELEQQFNLAKEAISSAVTLSFPQQGAPLCISSDASGLGMAGVLEQYVNNSWQPLAFFSKKFSDADKRESTYNRELSGAFNAVRHFRNLIEGKGCALVVDHAPLRGSFRSHNDALTDKQRRQLSYLSEMVSDIYPIAGKHNVVADMLSRLPICPVEMSAVGLDMESLARYQEGDPDRQHLHPPRFDYIQVDGVPVLCDMSDYPKVWVSEASRRMILDFFHQQAHQGVKQTRRAIATRFKWPGMTKTIQDYVPGCVQCQRAKVTLHNKPPSQHFVVPNARFEHVHLDFVGRLPISNNNNEYMHRQVYEISSSSAD